MAVKQAEEDFSNPNRPAHEGGYYSIALTLFFRPHVRSRGRSTDPTSH